MLMSEIHRPVEIIDKLLTADLDIFFRPGNFKMRHRRTLEEGVMASWVEVAAGGITPNQLKISHLNLTYIYYIDKQTNKRAHI